MTSEVDIVERLRRVAGLKPGDLVPNEVFPEMAPNNWGVYISALAGEAADEIERLRASIRGLPLTQELHPFREIKDFRTMRDGERLTGNYSEYIPPKAPDG